ncbi:MAG: hypothetical protein Q9175_007218 [Cornicularia normoerica]
MTSLFARNRGLDRQTLEAYQRAIRNPLSVNDTLDFYCTYLQDVAPEGLIVHHIPVDLDNEGRVFVRNPPREEIQLCTSHGMVFMSGLVSLEFSPRTLERTAGDEAYTKWLHGEFIPDGNNWRFFTCQARIKFFNNYNIDEWDSVGTYHPIQYAEEVAAFLQEEFDKLEFR